MPAPTSYTVRSGDTLSLIASRFGTTLSALVNANRDRYPSLPSRPGDIRVGWTLAIPAAGEPSGPPSNDSILYIGMNPRSTYEANALRGTGARVTAIHDATVADQVKSAAGQTYDLSTPEGASAFTATFGLPAARTAAVTQVILEAYTDARDELGRMAEVWAAAERGGTMPSRLVLSGHSVGSGVWGDDNGTLTLDSIGRLAEAMPEAARRVEDIHIAGCYSGGAYAMDRLRAIFPKVKTIWAYSGSAPAAGPGAARHETLWEAATRGSRADLDRAIAAHTGAGENVAVWSLDRGYQDGNPPLPLDALRADMDLMEPTFAAHFRGEEQMTDPQSGPLRDYYNALQAYMQHPDFPASERPARESRRNVTIRLIYYGSTVARHFASHYASAIQQGFAAVSLPVPDFATLSRQEALARIAAFARKVREQSPQTGSDAALAQAASLLPILENGLVNLDPALIPDAWV